MAAHKNFQMRNIISSGTILSGMFAMANGTAFADQYLRKIISVYCNGDGGMEEGIVYEL